MNLSAGTKLGPYEIVSAIGAGGMGEVYRARDARLNRDVALKVLPSTVAQDPDRVARFRREAQVLASLNHPNIAHIHGVEEDRGASGEIHALVMELVEGPTLADRIAQGPIPVADALPIARQIAEALESAHEQGIVHRDLKPSNIKVRDDGTVKVLDFGLAKALSADASGVSANDVMNSPTLTARATQLGVIIGTAAYMAPEQAKGRAVDRRADIWAFGVVLFEMLAGRRGYEAEDISETLAAVLTREVDWTVLPAATPARLKALIRECLVRDPKQRLRDIGEARRELQKMIDGPVEPAAASAAAPPTTGWRRLVRPAFVAGAALLAGVAGTAIALRPAPAPPRNVVRAEVLLEDFSAILNVSRDGSRLAYTVASGQSTTHLALRMLDQFEARPIPGADGGAWPVFSPDGQWIAYSELNGSKIRKIPLTGGTSITLCDGSFLFGAAWGADDTIIFAGSDGLMQVPAGGGTPARLTSVDQAQGELSHRRPQFLPGGTHLLFTVQRKGTDDEPQFAVLDLAARTYRTVARGGTNGRYVMSGHLAYVRGGTLFAVPFDLKTMDVRGTEVPVVEKISQVGPADTADFAVSDDGLLAYFSAAGTAYGTTLAWASRDGVVKSLPGASTTHWGTGRLSPDGRFVANGISDAKGGRDMWIFDVERGTATRVTFGGTHDRPAWTRDSRRIFFTGVVGGKTSIYRAPIDGSAKPEALLEVTPGTTVSSVSPDGGSILYTTSARDEPLRLMIADLNERGVAGKPRPLHESSVRELQAEISPDGRWVAYVSHESGAPEIYVHSFPTAGARIRVSTEGGGSPRWSRDGRELFYWAGTPTTKLMAVEIPGGDALRPGPPKQVFRQLVGTTWDVTPDRDRFLIELTSSTEGVRLATVTNWFEELKRRAPAGK